MEMDTAIKSSTEPSGTTAVLTSTTTSVGTFKTAIKSSQVKRAEETNPSVASHRCVFCSQMFDTKLALQEHFRRHANGEIDIKGMLKVNQKPKTKSKVNSKGEDKTVYISEGGQPQARFEAAVCDICNEVFRSTSSAITHKFRKHPESVEKHYCPHCGMMFPIKANRDKHVSSHGTSTKPNQVFPCLPCKVAFYNERARSFHIESAHKGALRLVNPIQTPAPSLKIVVNNAGEAQSIYYCHLCGCEYQVKYNLQKHLVSRHTEEERNATPQAVVQCSVCSALFYSERAYAAHSLHHRQQDLYATCETMRQHVVQRIDQDFDLRRVPTPLQKFVSSSAIRQNRSETWKSIRAANKKGVERKGETSVSEYFENDLSTENNSKIFQNKSKIEEEINKNVDLKDSNQNIFSEPSDNDRTKKSNVSLSKIMESKDIVSDCIKKDNICLKKTRHFEPKLIENVNINFETDAGAELLNNLESDKNLDCMKEETLENIVCISEDHDDNSEGVNTCGIPLSSETKADVSEKSKLTSIVQQIKSSNSHNEDRDDSESEELEVEKIVGMRKAVDGGREYLVRWQGFEPADDTWEKEHFLNCPLLLQQFLSENNQILPILERVKCDTGESNPSFLAAEYSSTSPRNLGASCGSTSRVPTNLKRVGPSDVECYTNVEYKKRKT